MRERADVHLVHVGQHHDSRVASGIDQRVGQAEDRLHQANVTALAKLDAIESDAA